jgi:hypothetical protein
MSMSRKRQKELQRLKRSAEELWDEQKQTLDHATQVLKDARRQASMYAREDLRPAVSDVYHGRLKPAVATGVAATRYAARSTKERIVDDVVPAVSGAIGSALAVLEAARDPRVREVVRKASGQVSKVIPTAEKKSGPGRYILIGLGVVAAAGIAYAAWQTLRVDEDLWIEDLGDGVEGETKAIDDEAEAEF